MNVIVYKIESWKNKGSSAVYKYGSITFSQNKLMLIRVIVVDGAFAIY